MQVNFPAPNGIGLASENLLPGTISRALLNRDDDVLTAPIGKLITAEGPYVETFEKSRGGMISASILVDIFLLSIHLGDHLRSISVATSLLLG
ncbi:hypothetical protein [Corynebacterium variabile]|uniref:hypothetical protein n=1 Tax=Corynebacterium variabile TaxID=1727 RepID=UPI0011474BFF|nr:hypothetical protein [Corynebacterium variabile]